MHGFLLLCSTYMSTKIAIVLFKRCPEICYQLSESDCLKRLGDLLALSLVQTAINGHRSYNKLRNRSILLGAAYEE